MAVDSVGRPRSRGRAGRAVVAAAGVMAFVVLAVSGGGWYVDHGLRDALGASDALDQAGGNRSGGGAMNLLLLGLDSRYDLNDNPLPRQLLNAMHVGSDSDVGGNNTNTMILMHIPARGRVTAFSIPRDDWVDAPGLGMVKIKQAYGLAKAREQSALADQGVKDHAVITRRSTDAALSETIKTVQSFTGQPVDHFALVNLDSFYNIATALGGIQVCLLHAVDDKRYSGAVFPAGRQTLNAIQAVEFVRQRHGLTNGDLDRTHRQQAFLAGVTLKLKQDGVFADFGRLKALMNVVAKDVIIDSGWDPLSFVGRASALTGGNVRFATLPIRGYAIRAGQDVNLVDPAQIQAIMAAAFRDQPAATPSPPPPPSPSPQASASEPPADPASVELAVANGATVTGLARRVSAFLVGRGFARAADGGNEPGGRVATTTLTYPAGRLADARAVATALGLPSAALRPGAATGALRLVLGADYGVGPGFHGADTASPSPPATAIPTAGAQGAVVNGGGVPCVA